MDLTRRAFGLGALGLLLSACGEAVSAAPERRGDARRLAVGALTPAELAAAQRSLGIDLLDRLAKPGANTSVSPVSLALALGLLTAAAAGDTEKAISKLLHLPRWSDVVVAAYAEQHRQLVAIRDQLQLSNRVYTASGTDPQQRTLDDWATGFDASLAQLDFVGERQASRARINADVKADTRGLIPELLEEPPPPETVAVLVSALHLKAAWLDPFNDDQTSDAAFTTDTGRKVTVRMMTGAAGALREVDGWQSVTLAYEGQHLEMVALLPPSGTAVESVTATQLAALTSGDSRARGFVKMPSLDLEQTHQLRDLLAAMGLPVRGADYSGIGADGIDQVVQKTVLKVDEQGTEAAAATAATATAVSAFSGREVVLDRPYLLLLQDTATRSPLFLTRVVDPTA